MEDDPNWNTHNNHGKGVERGENLTEKIGHVKIDVPARGTTLEYGVTAAHLTLDQVSPGSNPGTPAR